MIDQVFYALPPSCKFVFYILERNIEGLTRKELIEVTRVNSRTIGTALRILYESGYIEKSKIKRKGGRDKRPDKRMIKYILKKRI
jgi:DNA-binding transcriptional ArsR family regulator